MKKKIFFASIGIAALAALSWVTWLYAKIILPNHHTYLLFTYVTNYYVPGAGPLASWGTAILISNTSKDPFGTSPESGTCTFYFYGSSEPLKYTTPDIAAGST